MRWLRRRSIRVRVTLAASTVLGLALVVAAFALVALERRSLVREIDRGLDDRIAGLIESASLGELGADVPVTGRETGVVQIVAANGTVLAATPGLAGEVVLDRVAPRVERPAFASVADVAVAGEKAERWRIAALRVPTPVGPIDIYAASSLAGVDRTIGRLEVIFLLGIPLLVAGLVLVVWRSTGWALAPVDSLNRQVDEIESEQLDRTLTEPDTRDEIARLAVTMNGLLRRLHDARVRERRFAADASHELRSPLAAARLGLEVALAHPDRADWPAVAEDTLAELARLEQLSRDLLDLTRVDPARTMTSARPVELSELVRAEMQLRSTGNPGLRFTLELTPVSVSGVPELLLRALRNVLDNAQRHAHQHVDVRLTRPPSGGAELTVANDGPPVPAEDRVRVFQPFVRLDESRAVDDGGTGLGLAIVADIVRAHGGHAEFVDPPEGFGAALRLRLP